MGTEQFRVNAVAGSPPDTPFTIGSTARVAEKIEQLAEAGIRYFLVYSPASPTITSHCTASPKKIIPAFHRC